MRVALNGALIILTKKLSKQLEKISTNYLKIIFQLFNKNTSSEKFTTETFSVELQKKLTKYIIFLFLWFFIFSCNNYPNLNPTVNKIKQYYSLVASDIDYCDVPQKEKIRASKAKFCSFIIFFKNKNIYSFARCK